MSLTLTIRNTDKAPEGVVTRFALEGDAAVIGPSHECFCHLLQVTSDPPAGGEYVGRDGFEHGTEPVVEPRPPSGRCEGWL